MKKESKNRLWLPKYWLSWCSIAILYVLVLLPFNWRIMIARSIAPFAPMIARRRYHIIKVNINKCYPELSLKQRRRLVKRTTEEQLIGFLEFASAYWDPSLQSRITIENADAIKKALAKGRGVICVGAHYTSLDIGIIVSRILKIPLDITYRPFNNPVIDKVIATQRKRKLNNVIPHKKMRQMVKSLKAGNVLSYMADQDYGRRHAVFSPFFNIPAATTYITSRLARINASPVLVFACHRDTDNRYIIRFSDTLSDFPSDDLAADATKVNRVMEDFIRKKPEQYMWVHRRFKTRPEGEADFYS